MKRIRASWRDRFTKIVGAIGVILLSACAHSQPPTNDELVEGVSVNSEAQLSALANTAESSRLNSQESILTGSVDVSGANVISDAALGIENSNNNEDTMAVATTDDLVAQMAPEPYGGAVLGRREQGQADLTPTFSEQLAAREALPSKPVLVAKASKQKHEEAVVPEVPTTIPAPAHREPDSVAIPEKATTIPNDSAPLQNEKDDLPLMEPSMDEELKSQNDREQVLASPEIGGVLTRPWFPWIAIALGFIGFGVLAVLKIKRRQSIGD